MAFENIDLGLFVVAQRVITPGCAHRVRELLLRAGRVEPTNPDTAEEWRVLLGAGKTIVRMAEDITPILHGEGEPTDAEKRRAIVFTSFVVKWREDFRALCFQIEKERIQARARMAAEPVPDLAACTKGGNPDAY